MAANGQLVFTDVDKVTFKGVGNTSNAVIDTITGKLGVGVDSPDANLHIIGNCFVSTDLTASTLSGNGSGLTALNATNITTGTLDAARIPVLDAAKITSGTFAQARIPLLSGVTGVFDPNVDDIKIGNGAGTTSQGSNSVAVGHDAGKTSQGTQAVAVGYLAGNGTQGDNAVAVGIQAGSTGQGDNAIAVGRQTGVTSQGDNAVAVGYLAGNDTQGTSAVAVGIQAGQSDQGDDAIAIGHYSGQTNQGNKAVAVGYAAGLTDQHANSIILNASGVTLDSGGASRFYVKPIRAATEASNVVTYNATTGEVLDCKGITVNTLGHVTAIKILGDGSGLTALSALNVTTGLLDTLRIPDLPASKITSGTLPVTRGGTGTTTSTGTGSVVLSAAPAFTGDVTFDTDTLKIDSTNNRVGIGTTSPEAKLHVKGGSICVHRTFPDTPDAGIVFMEDHSNKDCMFIAYDGGGVAETSDESLRFYSKSAGGADPTITGANLLMTLQGNGLVQFSYTEKFNLFYAPAAWGYSTTSTTDTNLWTFDVTIPQEGYLILNTNGHWNHSVAGYYIYAKIGVDSNDPSDTSGFYDSHTIGGASTNGGDFHSYKDSSVSWQDFNWSGILKVAAGTRTICMRVKTPQGGTVYINGAAVSMLYIPKNYF